MVKPVEIVVSPWKLTAPAIASVPGAVPRVTEGTLNVPTIVTSSARDTLNAVRAVVSPTLPETVTSLPAPARIV